VSSYPSSVRHDTCWHRAVSLQQPNPIAVVLSVVQAKFQYAIQVADLVSDLAFDKFVRVYDQLATFFGRKQSQTGSSYLDMSK